MYKSLSDYGRQVKKDWIETWEDDNMLLNKKPELLILQFANLLLVLTFVYIIVVCVSHYVDRINNLVTATAVFAILLQSMTIFLKALNFKVIERFSILEIFKFELKPSYQLYAIFLILNLFSLMVLKLASINYLFNSRHVRTK